MKSRMVLLLVLSAAVGALAAKSERVARLTLDRVRELSAPTENPVAKEYRVKVEGIGDLTLPADGSVRESSLGRDFIYPTEFDMPTAVAGSDAVTPTTPTVFERTEVGWRLRLTAKPQGKLVELFGTATYAEAALLPGGYGALAGPIYSEKGLLTENRLDQPRIQSTETRFHIFAVPGEKYRVTFYRGTKAEAHEITLNGH